MKIITIVLITIFGVGLLWKFGYNLWYRIKVLKGKIIWPWTKKKPEAKIVNIGLNVCAGKDKEFPTPEEINSVIENKK